MTPQDYAELISLGLTAPTIVISVLVIYLWGPSAFKILCGGIPRNATDWFILGVTIGFVGSVGDNFYWGVAWTCSYLQLDITDSLIQQGVYWNIFLRQLCGTIAAYCHVRSYSINNAHDSKAKLAAINLIMFLSWTGMVVYMAVLLVLRDTIAP